MNPIGGFPNTSDGGGAAWHCPNGDFWLNISSLANPNLIFRFASDGRLAKFIDAGFRPAVIVADRLGNLYAAGYNPVNPAYWAPLTKWTLDGVKLWLSTEATENFAFTFPKGLMAEGAGSIWFFAPEFDNSYTYQARAVRVDPHDGSVLDVYRIHYGTVGNNVSRIQPTISENVWIRTAGYVGGNLAKFQLTDGSAVSNTWDYPFIGQSPDRFRVGPNGEMYFTSGFLANMHTRIKQVDAATGAFKKEFELGDVILNFALSPTGEEIYGVVLIQPVPPPTKRRIFKLSLVTGQLSKIDINDFYAIDIPDGDPTGFLFASVYHPDEDNDHDGYKNRDEVAAGYNPYDSRSHPGGPKVYVWFDPSAANALNVTYHDPDGVFDTAAGLDPSSFALLLEHPAFGTFDIFTHAFSVSTNIIISPDGTKLTVEFGNLIIPLGSDFSITAIVNDKTSARGWDWHRVP